MPVASIDDGTGGQGRPPPSPGGLAPGSGALRPLASSSQGPRARRRIRREGLHQVIAFISRITAADLAQLEGVSAQRSHQLLAGAVVAEAAMKCLEVETLDLCPWALREGIILRRLDQLGAS